MRYEASLIKEPVNGAQGLNALMEVIIPNVISMNAESL
jgi:hypothetical protein